MNLTSVGFRFGAVANMPPKSMVWNVFTKVEGGARCNDCKKVYKMTGGNTTGLFTHLKQHPTILKEIQDAQKAAVLESRNSKKRSFSESMATPKISEAFENASKYLPGHIKQVNLKI